MTTTVNSLPNPIPVTWKVALRPFWAYAWRMLILTSISDAILDSYIENIPWLGTSTVAAAPVSMLLRAAFAGIVSYYIIRLVFTRSYQHFDIKTVTTENNNSLSLSDRQTLNVWWAVTWRLICVFSISIVLKHYIEAGYTPEYLAAKETLSVPDIIGLIYFILALTYLPWQIFSLVLQKRFKHFHFIIVPRHTAISPDSANKGIA